MLQTKSSTSNSLLNPGSIFVVALSLSIGWGIRGNFGHESGAWIPGALSAIAICLMSGREDWWRRAGYCALFGGLGWGFGGSIAYMTTLSYCSSGLLPSIWYGYGAVFFVGGLWAAMGAAGTVLPLCVDRDRLTRMFGPLCFVLVAMYLGQWIEAWLTNVLAADSLKRMKRHENPLYWLDSDWFEASFALIGICLYDLWSRRFAKFGILVLCVTVGLLLGYLGQQILDRIELTPRIVATLVAPQGDPTAVDPETNTPYDPSLFIANWPRVLFDFHAYVGAGLGLIIGLVIYFRMNGQWRNDAGLLLSMAIGWWIAFLCLPVLLSIPFRDYGGFRLTPPRGDNWAGILGVFLGMCVYSMRHGLMPVVLASSRNFILGGIGFATVHIVRSIILTPGHPDINWRTGIPPEWKHYQSANWHSVLEQSHGFALGLATVITMATVWRRLKPLSDDPPIRRWTDIVSIGGAVFGLTWFNVFKNVEEWTEKGLKIVPAKMHAPFIESIELSAQAWFSIAWWTIALAFVALMIVHVRRGLLIVPKSWGGRAQLIFFFILWIMVIANLQRAMASPFHEQRLVTEWLALINSALVTFLIILLPAPNRQLVIDDTPISVRELVQTWAVGLCVAAGLMSLYANVNHRIYGDAKINMPNIRWGPKADWRARPLLKNRPHR